MRSALRRESGEQHDEPRAAGCSPKARRRTSEAGQSPTATNSSRLIATNAVTSANHGETNATAPALTRRTVPASANSARSSGQRVALSRPAVMPQ